MAARRGRKRRRRGRFSFLYKLLSFVLILAALIVGCVVFFRVEEITVIGSTVYSDEEIIAAAGVEKGNNLFRILAKTMRTGKKIVDQLPYVDTVNLRPVLPNTLVITVTECTPVAVLEGERGTWWVIDGSCKLLEQGGSELKLQYPQISGLTALMPVAGSKLAVAVEESAKLNALEQLLLALAEREMLEQVQGIDLSGVSEIRMDYEDRFTVRMPLYSEDFHLLVHQLQESAAYLNLGQTGTIDLTGERPHYIPG